jgi:hypothetical protein
VGKYEIVKQIGVLTKAAPALRIRSRGSTADAPVWAKVV